MKHIDWIKITLIFSMLTVLLILIQRYDQFQSSNTAKTRLATTPPIQVTDPPIQSPSLNNAPTTTEGFNQQTQADFDTDAPRSTVNKNQDLIDPIAERYSIITVNSEVLQLEIDLLGGDIVSAHLKKYYTTKESKQSIQLLQNKNNQIYIAQSGLIGKDGIDKNNRPLYQVQNHAYILTDTHTASNPLHIDLVYTSTDNVQIIKRFSISNQSYLIGIEYLIDNASQKSWRADLSAQIRRSNYQTNAGAGIGMAPFVGAAITTPEERYKRFDFDDLQTSYQQTVDSGWVAMVERYFVSAFIPDNSKPIKYSLRQSKKDNSYMMGYTQAGIDLSSNQQGRISSQFYVGPKDQYALHDISNNLDLTVDYGWLWWAAQPLYAVLKSIYTGTLNLFGYQLKLYGGVHNWGVAIIILTLLVKLLFFKLSATSYKSMAKMRVLQPQMLSLKERFGDDRQKMSQETMKLYKKEKVNPLGGCLPMLIQMPIFLALYWVLLESIELRHAPFMLWITDLSAKDPLFILPLLMGGSMFIQFRLNPTPPDPMQAKLMQYMPLFFTFMFLWFPSGLVLYWTVNNILSIIQQWVITRSIEQNS